MKTNRLWIAGTAIATIAILALGYLLGIAPKLAEAADADIQTAQVVEANRVKRVELANLKEQFKLIDTIKAELADIQTALPATPEYSNFIRDLNRYARTSNTMLYSLTTSVAAPAQVTISGSAPAPAPVTAPASSSTPAPTASPAATGPTVDAGSSNTGATFNAIPVTITVRGSYSEVTKFLGLFQTGSRLTIALLVDLHVPSDAPGFELVIGSAMFTLANSPGYPDVIAGADKLSATPTPSPSPTGTPTPSPSVTAKPTPTPSPSN